MNKNALITSALGIALLLPAAAPALAQSASGDDAVEINPTNTIRVKENATNGDASLPHDVVQVNLHRFLHAGAQSGDDATSINNTNTINVKQQIRKDSRASSTEARMEHVDAKAGNAINARIRSLTALSTRIAGIRLLATSTVTQLQASLTAEISALNALKAQIDADTSTTTLKADAQSITKANRVYLLVEPKARIAAASARIDALVSQFTQLGTKLDTRISAAASAGKDMTSARAALTDFNAKVADAKVQADAAVSLTVNLQADNGDKTVMAANKAALQQARQKLQAAEADLKAARKDAGTIAKAVKGTHVTATTTAEVH